MAYQRISLVVAESPLVTARFTRWCCALVAAAMALTSVNALRAHDFWLVPDAFSLVPGGRIGVRGQTSSLFPTSLSAVTPDRIVNASVLTASAVHRITALSTDGASLRLAHTPAVGGQHMVAVQLAPRTVRESPASFRRYLDLEGAPEARERYERDGLLPVVGGDSLTRRYAKYAKTLVEVGRGARAFDRVAGHPLEFIPLSDPSALRAGDTLRLRLLLLGKPAAFARLHAGSVPERPSSRVDTSAARRASIRDVAVSTDSAGVATVVITTPGLWNVRTLQIVPAHPRSGADWDVHWATLVFRSAPR